MSFTEKLKYSCPGKLSINVCTSTLLVFCFTTYPSNSRICDFGQVLTREGSRMRVALGSNRSIEVRKVPITMIIAGRSISYRVFL